MPCETQEPPDLNAPLGVGEQPVQAKATRAMPAKERRQLDDTLEALREYARDSRAGRKAVDPLVDPSVIGKDRRGDSKEKDE